MKPLHDVQEYYCKRMLDLQEQLRKSEEERIRLEERFNLLVRESRNRHQECINRLRMRYVEYLEDQRMRDERNNRLLGKLDKIDHGLTLMTAKTERLNNLRKQYEAYLLRTYGNNNQQRPSGSVTADSGLESQREQEIIPVSPVFQLPAKSIASRSLGAAPTTTTTMRVPDIPVVSYKLPSYSWLDGSRAILTSGYVDRYDVEAEETSDCLLRDFTVKPVKTTTTPIVDPVSTAERNLEQYLNQIKQMHKDVDKSELFEHSADEAEQNTSGDLLNVSLTEDNFEAPSVEEEITTREKMRLRFARQAFAARTPPNSFDKTTNEPTTFRDRLRRQSDEMKKPVVEESTRFSETISPVRDGFEFSSYEPKAVEETKLPTFAETMSSFKDRFKRSAELASSQSQPEVKTVEEAVKIPTFSETISSFKDRLKLSQPEPKPTEETTKVPTFPETISSFKDRLKLNQSEPKEDTTPTFSESIGSLREKFNRTDFASSRVKPITPDSFEDAFAKLTRMKEPRAPPEEIPVAAQLITEELPTPPPEEEENTEKESSSDEPENDGIEDDYDDTVDIESWQPDDVEPEPQEVKRKDDILELPRRKLESIEEVEHAEDEEVEEDEEVDEVEIQDTKDVVVIEEVVEDDNKENVESKNVDEIVDQPKQEEKAEALNVGYETQEQVATDPNATYNDQQQQQQQQYYEQDGQQYYEQADAQQYQYTDDPNYAYDPNAQYDYTGYEQYQYDPSQYDPNQQYDPSQYDPSQYDPSQYDPNQQYQHYAGYQEADPNQTYTAEAVETYQQPEQSEKAKIDSEPAASQTAAATDEAPKKKKDAIKAILDSDSESFIERNLSNTESDFDFN